jgi:hypothetical protein
MNNTLPLLVLVAKAGQGMSPDTIAVGVFTIAGTLLGVVVGALIERLLRLSGRLRFEAPRGWEYDFYRGDPEDSYTFGIITDEDPEKEATQVRYRVAINLFNGKEVPTGLQDIAIVLVHEDGKRSSPSRPDDLTTGRPTQHSGYQYDAVTTINVPPRQFVHKDLSGSFGREEAVALATGKWNRVEFVGKRPKRPLLWRKTYRKTIQNRA